MPQFLYYDRDLSWLSFNFRVLCEAADKTLPLYERIKFLAIYSSNLDEFFRVRVASARSLIGVKKKKRADLDFSPEQRYDAIIKEVNRQLEVFGEIFQHQILPELRKNNIHLLQGKPQHPEHLRFISQLFDEEISPYMHPELLRRKRIQHFLRDNVPYLAVKLYSRSERAYREAAEHGNEDRRSRWAILLVPTHYFPRFICLPTLGDQHYIMFLDDVIRYNLGKIFVGYDIKRTHAIKLNRNADLMIEDEFNGDLVEKIRKSLLKRQTGVPARFLYDQRMGEDMLRYLMDAFNLTKGDLVAGGRYHNFHDFFSFPNPFSPDLERQAFSPLRRTDLEQYPNMAEAMKHGSWLLHFPYESYDYVLRFLNGAAADPTVYSIKTTQYRVASNSAIVNALIRAARNGKDVTVFVELKARFDEQINLISAQEMKEAGVKIIYSLPGLKVHAKVALVEREEQGLRRGYAFLSTGNFNEKTARLYCDHGYFTTDLTIIEELKELFLYLGDQTYRPKPFRKLLVAQFNLREGLYALIDREIREAQQGNIGQIIIKLNNLEDRGMIDKLYEASKAGVRIQMLVRSVCAIRPGLVGVSENITVTRIVDQFLEHARVFAFYHSGKTEVYMGSADWMNRNLERRIEVVFPVEEDNLKTEILEILRLQLADNVKAVRLNKHMDNIPIKRNQEEPPLRAQQEIYERIQQGRLLSDAETLFPIPEYQIKS